MRPLTTPPTLRAARTDDLTQVQWLARKVWRSHYPGIITAMQIEDMLERGYALDALRAFLDGPGRGIELAFAGDALTGFAAWMTTPDPRQAKLDRIYVDPAWQRVGIGGRLIARVCDEARMAGASALVLNVNKRNVTAQNAYRKHGFTVQSDVVIDIGGGFVMDDYVMGRPL